MAGNSDNQRLVIYCFLQFSLYKNLVFIVVINNHILNVSLLLRHEFSDCSCSLVPVHLWHIAVHEYDAVEPPMFNP